MLSNSILIIGVIHFLFQSAVLADFVCDFTIPNINCCPQTFDSVTILATVIKIPDQAFYGCHTLLSVVINLGITELGYQSFMRGSMASITIPSSVTNFGSSTFEYSALVTVFIPDGVTALGDDLFYGCFFLKSIVIPDSVTFLALEYSMDALV